jgi:hypothetical protein
MIKNVLTEEITRINNIIHGNKLLTESIIESSLIKNIIKKSIKTVIDDVVSKALKNDTLAGGKDNLIYLIKMRGSDAVYNELTLGTSEISKEVLRKSIKTLKDEGYDHIDDNTIRAQISNELNTESSRNEIKASVKKEIEAAKSKLENIKKPIDNTKPKNTRGDWFNTKSKTQLPVEPEFQFKPNSKPSDLGIVPTSEMKAELQVLNNSLNEQSKKTLLDYFKKGGKATYEGLKKLGKIGFLDKTTGKVNRKKLVIWGTVLGTTGALYAIGRWMGDNPETIEDDNLIDDGGSDDNKTTSDDNKTTTDDNKPTINKPTDGKPTGGGTTGGGTTGGGTTGGGNTYDTEYDMPGYNAVDLDWNKLKM